jgi:hypothetical protein
MSLINWFTRKPEAAPTAKDSSGLGDLDATRPLLDRDRQPPKPSAAAEEPVARRYSRTEARELLFTVVRETMVKSGVLSSSYKFKVLSLDAAASKFLVMIDVARELEGSAPHWSMVETLIAQAAKARYGILVTAVYWRWTDQVVAVGSQAAPRVTAAPSALAARQPTPSQPAPLEFPAAAGAPLDRAGERFDPIDADEVAAFKNALTQAREGGADVAQPIHPGTSARPAKRDDDAGGLSSTQYGDL